jgi:uncharacterized protein with HEPN domain
MADIIENAERVEGYVAGMDRSTFERDGRTRDAVERGWSGFARLRIAWASVRRS